MHIVFPELARELGLTRDQATRAVRRLVARGILLRRDRIGRPRAYALNLTFGKRQRREVEARSVREMEYRLRMTRALRRVVQTLDLEPFTLGLPSVLGPQYDVVDAIDLNIRTEPMRRLDGLSSCRWPRYTDRSGAGTTTWGSIHAALRNLLSKENEGLQTVYLSDLGEIASSKSQGTNFRTIEDFTAHAGRNIPCTSRCQFDDALAHAFPADSYQRFEYRTWRGRYRWANEEGSHHAAVARQYALEQAKLVDLGVLLTTHSINRRATSALRSALRGFLCAGDGMPDETHLGFCDFGVDFRSLRLNIAGRTREALLIPLDTRRNRVVAKTLLAQLRDPRGELTAVLELAAHNQTSRILR